MTGAAQLEAPASVLAAGTPAASEDQALVSRVLAGDRIAEQLLFRRHASAVGGVLVRLLGRKQEAEDVLQETFLVAFESLSTLRDANAVRAWLLKIAIRRARRSLRKRRFLETIGLAAGVDDAALDVLAAHDAGPEERAELALAERILKKLPAKERIAWMLRHVEGFSLEEIAEATGASLATAKRRIAAAKESIDKEVQR